MNDGLPSNPKHRENTPNTNHPVGVPDGIWHRPVGSVDDYLAAALHTVHAAAELVTERGIERVMGDPSDRHLGTVILCNALLLDCHRVLCDVRDRLRGVAL